jgi:hypothetical protein
MPYRNGFLKIEPRDAGDVGFAASDVARLEPPTSFVRTGAAAGDTFPEPLRVVLTRVSSSDTVVSLSSSNPNIDVPATVMVLAGQASALIPVSASGPAVTSTITASATSDVTASVQSIAPDAPASAVSISPPSALLAFGGTVELTVAFDIPAPVGGASLTVDAGSFGSAPASVVVPENATSVQFTFTAGDAAGSDEVIATLGDAVSATIDVVDPSDFVVDLGGYKLVQTNTVSGALRTFTIPSGTQVLVNGSLVIGRNASASEFATYWGALPAGSAYVDGGDNALTINADAKTFTFTAADNTVIDGPSVLSQVGKSVQRRVPVGPSNVDGEWIVGEDEPGAATPGGGQVLGGSAGCYVSEISDASGTGNFIYEFVEVHCDGAIP